VFYPMHHIGMHGMPRRYFAYDLNFSYINNLCLIRIMMSRTSWVLVCLVIHVSRMERLGLNVNSPVVEMIHRTNLPQHTFISSL
jgi:heme/copper-type cytochrome/quinol oxidase subunit 1